MNEELRHSKYWNDLYENNETKWDIGYPSTPIKEYIDQLPSKNISILIPGCGNSYEAEYLLQKGFTNVTVIDISTLLTAELEKKFSQWNGKELTIVTGDFFAFKGQFDLILEQTFFCSQDPAMRPVYVEQMHKLLKPSGKLAGVMFEKEFEEGPPFGGNRAEYQQLFSKLFTIQKMENCYNSIAPRAGAELFVIMTPKK